jgi:hypothetical protein
MQILRADVAIILLVCVLAPVCVSFSASNDSPVLGADMPLYPALARTAKITGKAEVQVVTGADGRLSRHR